MENKFKEYEILSEDRRRAIEIYMRGLIIVIAVYGIGVKIMIDQSSLLNIIIIGSIGAIISPLGLIYGNCCKNHNDKLYKNLNEIAKDLELIPIISTNYIFNAIFIGGIVLTFFWIGIFIIMIIINQPN